MLPKKENTLEEGKRVNVDSVGWTFLPIGGDIEFIRFKEYYGMSRGSRSGIYARFSGKKRTSREKGDHCYIQKQLNDLFSHYNLFIGILRKNWPTKHE